MVRRVHIIIIIIIDDTLYEDVETLKRGRRRDSRESG